MTPSPEHLVEYFAATRAICVSEIGRDPFDGRAFDVRDSVGGICLWLFLNGQNEAQVRQWLHDQAEAVAYRNRPPAPPPVVAPPVVEPPVVDPPVVAPPPHEPPLTTDIAPDAIRMDDVLTTRESPDVSFWRVGTKITEFEIADDGTIRINFDKRNGEHAWKFVRNMEGGEIQYTLWIVCFIQGRWWACGAIEGISRDVNDNYLNTGPMFAVNVEGSGLGQLPKNWYYFAGEPLSRYQPQIGEMVGWFVTAGAQRRDDIHLVPERSNVIVAPFRVGRFV